MANDLSRNVSQPASREWTAGRIETLLSHFYRPNTSDAVEEAALMDWVKSLSGYTNAQIGRACDAYLKAGPNRRPTPRDIIGLIGSERSQDAKDRRAKLSLEDQGKLEGILDTARKWVSDYPEGHTLSQHGKQTLAYWGETA